MGVFYVCNGMELDCLCVGLLNVGIEEYKGCVELKVVYELIFEKVDEVNFDFVGFVEGGDISGNKVDIIVIDGFIGNVVLKIGEGIVSFIGNLLCEVFKFFLMFCFVVLLVYISLCCLIKCIDLCCVNGGVFLGFNGIVVKFYGSLDVIGVLVVIKFVFVLV